MSTLIRDRGDNSLHVRSLPSRLLISKNSSSRSELFTGWLDPVVDDIPARAMNSTVIMIFLAMSGVALGVAG